MWEIIVIVILLCVGILLAYYLYKIWTEFRGYKAGEQKRLEEARKQAIEQSRAVLGGKFTEQMTPYLPEFKYDPTEARFIGTPIDLVVFPGLAQGDPTEIVLIEVKTGRSERLSPKERKIRELAEAGKVRWELIYRTSAEEKEV